MQCSRANAGTAGATVAAAARQLGVSRPWASREANAAGRRIVIAEAKDPRQSIDSG
jgi:hypothetical protein